jgi:hypothetical protein
MAYNLGMTPTLNNSTLALTHTCRTLTAARPFNGPAAEKGSHTGKSIDKGPEPQEKRHSLQEAPHRGTVHLQNCHWTGPQRSSRGAEDGSRHVRQQSS